jgi:hypothetical protein
MKSRKRGSRRTKAKGVMAAVAEEGAAVVAAAVASHNSAKRCRELCRCSQPASWVGSKTALNKGEHLPQLREIRKDPKPYQHFPQLRHQP